jgi:hypothetical protein
MTMPIYKTSGASYIIQDLTYGNQSFRLANLDVTSCPAPNLDVTTPLTGLLFILFPTMLIYTSFITAMSHQEPLGATTA